MPLFYPFWDVLSPVAPTSDEFERREAKRSECAAPLLRVRSKKSSSSWQVLYFYHLASRFQVLPPFLHGVLSGTATRFTAFAMQHSPLEAAD